MPRKEIGSLYTASTERTKITSTTSFLFTSTVSEVRQSSSRGRHLNVGGGDGSVYTSKRITKYTDPSTPPTLDMRHSKQKNQMNLINDIEYHPQVEDRID